MERAKSIIRAKRESAATIDDVLLKNARLPGKHETEGNYDVSVLLHGLF
jgi:hypothetical protein